MRNVVLTVGQDDIAGAAGAVLARSVAGLHKGRPIAAGDVLELAALPVGTRLSLIYPGPDDVGEEEAAGLLGQALTGAGVAAGAPGQGRVRLHAVHTGLFGVNRPLLAALNLLPDIAVYSLYYGTPVAAGTVLAEAKITPLVAPRAHLNAALALLEHSPFSVAPFRPRRAALLIRERLAERAAERVAAVLRKKLAWFGSTLAEADVLRVGSDGAEVCEAMSALLDGGIDLLLTAGGSNSDPADAALSALPALGATLLRRGVPIHPGSLLWLAERGPALIIGVPSCGSLSEQTSLDLLLPRLLAHGPAALADLPDLAEGGLLTAGMGHRFARYDD